MPSTFISITGTVGVFFERSFGAGLGVWSLEGTLPTGLSFNRGLVAGMPTTAGRYGFSVTHASGGLSATWVVSLVIAAAASGSSGSGSGAGSGSASPVAQQIAWTWPQAEAYARTGGKIARKGWAGNYFYFDGALWWNQQFNAVTKAVTTLSVVQAGDMQPADFRATDWLAAAGEIVPADTLSLLRQITTIFP